MSTARLDFSRNTSVLSAIEMLHDIALYKFNIHIHIHILGTRNFYFQDRKNLKFQDIFQDIRVTKMRFFVISGAYNFGTFTAEAKITIRRHEVVYRLSSERKMIDLE